MAQTVFLSLGGNHQNSIDLLKIAIRQLEKIAVGTIHSSSFYNSPPWGFEANHDFVNCVLQLKTQLQPLEVLTEIHKIELDLGRVRIGEGYTSRPIDIDILYFGDQIIKHSKLEIPHPRMYSRNFVLEPFNEIWSFWIDPQTKKSISKLLKECEDSSPVTKY